MSKDFLPNNINCFPLKIYVNYNLYIVYKFGVHVCTTSWVRAANK